MQKMHYPKTMEANFILRDPKVLDTAFEYIRSLPPNPVMELIVKPYEKTRSIPANSHYWVNLTEYLKEISTIIKRISDETGYTPLEVKREIAKTLPPEHIAILFAKTPEIAHSVIKEICNVPTSTRLGTKKFMEFEQQMEQTIADITGSVRAFEGISSG